MRGVKGTGKRAQERIDALNKIKEIADRQAKKSGTQILEERNKALRAWFEDNKEPVVEYLLELLNEVMPKAIERVAKVTPVRMARLFPENIPAIMAAVFEEAEDIIQCNHQQKKHAVFGKEEEK